MGITVINPDGPDTSANKPGLDANCGMRGGDPLQCPSCQMCSSLHALYPASYPMPLGGMDPRVRGVFIGLVLEGSATNSANITEGQFLSAPTTTSNTPYPTVVTVGNARAGPCQLTVVEPVFTPWTVPRHQCPQHRQLEVPVGACKPCANSSSDSGFSECWCPKDPGNMWDAPKKDDGSSDPHSQECVERLTVKLPVAGKESPTPEAAPQNLFSATVDMSAAARSMLNKCGFYYPGLSMESARLALRFSPVGTFLLRDSSHPGFLLSLSAKTARGTTSVRIQYAQGKFRLDTAEGAGEHLPSFSCAIHLLQFYVRLTETTTDGTPCVWAESSGRRDTPVLLQRPHRHTVLKLGDLARRTVHRHTAPEDLCKLPLSRRHTDYLKEYPYWL